MSKYSLTYQLNHNIDWYAIVQNIYIHFSSGGSILPEEINKKEQNREIQHYIANILEEGEHDNREVNINNLYIKDVIQILHSHYNLDMENLQINDAKDNASIGFYSYCFWGYDKWGGTIYRLLAYPSSNKTNQILKNIDIPTLTHCMQFCCNNLENEIPYEFIRIF